ncbi:helix-turn-helix domain-containing protein, partial [Vibrio parahaemolyticus]
MSMELMVKALKLKIGNQGRKLVLIKLADNANDQGECWPSYQYIADVCEMSKRSAISHIQKLEDMGLLRRESRITKKGQSSNMYYLTLDSGETIQWSSHKKEGGKNIPTRGETIAPPSENIAPRGGENIAPRTCNSLEPVNEPVT